MKNGIYGIGSLKTPQDIQRQYNSAKNMVQRLQTGQVTNIPCNAINAKLAQVWQRREKELKLELLTVLN